MVGIFSVSCFGQKYPDSYYKLSNPFNIVGNRSIKLTPDYFSKEMSGGALVYLIIDDKCNVLNFAIIKIQVNDKARDNVFEYHDKKVFDMLTEKKYKKFNEQYYPKYLHKVYEIIKESVNKLKIEYSSDTTGIKKINEWVVSLSFE
jgi:hypothetical protein